MSHRSQATNEDRKNLSPHTIHSGNNYGESFFPRRSTRDQDLDLRCEWRNRNFRFLQKPLDQIVIRGFLCREIHLRDTVECSRGTEAPRKGKKSVVAAPRSDVVWDGSEVAGPACNFLEQCCFEIQRKNIQREAALENTNSHFREVTECVKYI